MTVANQAGMSTATPQQHRLKLWTGRILTAIAIVLMVVSAVMKLMHPPQVVEIFVGKFGYPQDVLPVIGVLELGCAVLYAIPRTAVLGAVLMTGYLGGAVATHVRVSDAFAPPLILGILAWLGLYLREDRLRPLLPLRRLPSKP